MTPIIREDIQNILEQAAEPLCCVRGKTVFVAGATGMVGQYLVHSLMAYGETLPGSDTPTVIAGVRDRTKANAIFGDYDARPNFRLHVSDVCDIEPDALSDVDYLIHTASPVTPAAFRDHPVDIITANVAGTARLLAVARRQEARLCLVSTMEVYGDVADRQQGALVSESDFGALDSLDQRSAYPESKRMAENLCVAYGTQYGTDFVIARLSHTYGPGMSLEDGRVQAQFMKSALTDGHVVMKSDGTRCRTSTYITDACTAILTILLKGTERKTYNVANNNAYLSIRELAEYILAAAGQSQSNLRIEKSGNSKRMWVKASRPPVLDCRKLTTLGWQPRVGTREGIERTIRHHQAAD